MKRKQLALLYLGSWAVLFAASFFTDAGAYGPLERALLTAALACVVPLLYRVSERGQKNKQTYTVYRPGSAEPVVRVEGEWIYRGAEEAASFYVKKGAVYSFQSMTPVCRVKDGRVYRQGQEEPFLIREGDRLVSCPEGETVYEIRP